MRLNLDGQYRTSIFTDHLRSSMLPSKDSKGNKITPKYSSNDYRKDIYA